MPRKRSPSAATSEDLVPEEAGEWEEVPDAEDSDEILARQRDWRDLEKYFEERDLKRRLDDEFWLGEDKPRRPLSATSRRKR